MQKKKIAQYCCAALVAAGIGLNIQNAIENYGIGENSLSLVATGGTGMSGSSSCFDGSISFSTCTYTNAVAVTQTIKRCGVNAGNWLLRGSRITTGIGAAMLIWEAWEQLTYQVYVPTKLSETICQSDGTMITRKFTRYICTEKHGIGSSNCDPIGSYFDVEGWSD